MSVCVYVRECVHVYTLVLLSTDEGFQKLAEFLLHYTDECLYSLFVSTSHNVDTHRHTQTPRVGMTSLPSASFASGTKTSRHKNTHRYTNNL